MSFLILDAWLLNQHERFSHWTQKMFGIDCFMLAKLCVSGSLLSCIAYAMGEYFFPYFPMSPSEYRSPLFLIGCIVLAIGGYQAALAIEKGVKGGLANKAKRSDHNRLGFTAVIFVLTAFHQYLLYYPNLHTSLLFSFFGIVFTLWHIPVIYFVSCDPLSPPSPVPSR